MNVLFEIENFPMSICTRSSNLDSSEELIHMKIVEDQFGMINVQPIVPIEKIYIEQHSSKIGNTWKIHDERFVELVVKYATVNIIDVGGGNGNTLKKIKSLIDNANLTLIDINPTVYEKYISTINKKYDPLLINNTDTVISSHFLEHVVDTKSFLASLRTRNPKYHIFSIPNFKKYAEQNYCATLMFEHPHFLTEERIESELAETGWKLVEKVYFKDHSIFYVTVPSEPNNKKPIKLDQSYLILNWLKYIKDRADEVKKHDKFYIFGAHFPYYYFLNFGVKEEQIIAVVDNDIEKCDRRMYGKTTKVIHSSQLPYNSKIVVEMGPYTDEIKYNLKNVIFI